MSRLDRPFRFVTEHNLVVLLLMLLVTGGVVAGIGQLETQSRMNGSSAVGDTEVAQKLDYIRANYGTNDSESNGTAVSPAPVYVRSDDNALSKAALLDSLEFQQRALENESVAAALGDREPTGVANLVAKRLAGSSDAALDDQIAALESSSASELERVVEETLAEGSQATALLPSDYEPGTATAESHRVLFRFESADAGDAAAERRTAATAALYEASQDRSGPEYFTLGEHAVAESNANYSQQMIELILPIALLAILSVLAFSYRDLVDVIVGFTGVVLSVLWMFGILGWMGIPAGFTLIIGPVLIVGLSVDYGLHVFMRYREEREARSASADRTGSEATREERDESEEIREPMARGLSSVAVALSLVTLTAAVGFMSNVTNEFALIRELSIGITLGVVSTFVVSLTLVPALKITVDRLLERVGLDRRKQPLGETRLLEPFLGSGVRLAKRAAPVVIVLALVAGSAGAVAWTDLDRQSVQQNQNDVADWKQNLPGPLAWETSEFDSLADYVDEHYRAADEDARSRSQVLLEGDVTSPAALAAVESIGDRAAEEPAVFQRSGSVPLRSPLSVVQSVAAEDDEFASALAEADTDGDGVPDRNVEGVYDALYAAAPEQASQVVERGGGEYRSLRVVVPIGGSATITGQADAMRAVAGSVSADGVDATAVGVGTLNEAELAQTTDSILTTLVVALAAVGLLLTLIYRFATGSATLGVVTAVPIVLVTALVVGAMYLLAIPLTLLTSLLLSLVIGLGIDYNIHVSDRFAQELERGQTVTGALRTAVTGTGGALLGSTLTSVGAFSALLLHPHPQITSFGALVVVALSLSFVVAVFVLPSLLLVWADYGSVDAVRSESPARDGPMAQD
ncbi:MMPL family transporter [Halosimplex litoreum]|uniref:MMPL family transporter n=1 Tax=Halosimplex litoreum TaxID=1198301 RepID=A0A7T3FWC9_9EURY|nr:MMPL family transporter [Halosimplex litoreum]QPV61981.1 MMPL family transporter [Halosimplex litoreum]